MTEWKLAGRPPKIESGTKIAARVRGKFINDSGDWQAGEFDGFYLNEYQLDYDGECHCEEYHDERGCPTSGWHTMIEDHDGFDEFYQPCDALEWLSSEAAT